MIVRQTVRIPGVSCVVLLALASSVQCQAQPSAARGGRPDFARVRQFIRERMVATSVPSIAVAVARDGKILWEEGFGWADRENRVPATEHTMYSLASVTKPMTATALMILKEHGKLDLDRPINDYLGEAKLKAWVGDAAAATVRRVADHTSGLPLHYQFFPEDEPHRRPPMEETIRRYGNLLAAPGERYQYSNLGYGILGHVIGRLSGQSYADFMRREIFLPLGMTHASVDIDPGLEKYTAVRYGRGSGRSPWYETDTPGSSAVWCSVHDLVRFAMFHLKAHLPDQKAILSDERIDAMQAPTVATGGGLYYGTGWSINPDLHGYRCVFHGGGMGGVEAILRLIPSEKIAVAAVCNTNDPLPHLVAHEVLSALLPTYRERLTRIRQEEAARAGRQQGVPPSAGAEPAFQPSADLLGEWRGSVHTYAGDLPLTLWFKDSGDVHARLGTQLKTLLNDVSFKENRLSGKMLGDIGTEDVNHLLPRLPYHLELNLRLRGDVLNGAIVAMSARNALSCWMELRRVR